MPVDIAVLQRLDKELLFAVLDAALDIQNCIDSGTDPIYINFVRKVVRYEILLPGITPGAMNRYSELRWKASGFLKKQGVVGDYHSDGNHDWDGVIEIIKPNENELLALIPELEGEIKRREAVHQFDATYEVALRHITQLAETFHSAVLSLRNRQHNRPDFEVVNEYDVQDFFHAMLRTRFKDVRREEYGPSYAGSSTRVDFYVKDDSIVLETKMTRDGLNDNQLGKQLILDIAHYK